MRKMADYAQKCGKRRRKGYKSQMNPPALLQSGLQEGFIGYDAGSFYAPLPRPQGRERFWGAAPQSPSQIVEPKFISARLIHEPTVRT